MNVPVVYLDDLPITEMTDHREPLTQAMSTYLGAVLLAVKSFSSRLESMTHLGRDDAIGDAIADVWRSSTGPIRAAAPFIQLITMGAINENPDMGRSIDEKTVSQILKEAGLDEQQRVPFAPQLSRMMSVVGETAADLSNLLEPLTKAIEDTASDWHLAATSSAILKCFTDYAQVLEGKVTEVQANTATDEAWGSHENMLKAGLVLPLSLIKLQAMVRMSQNHLTKLQQQEISGAAEWAESA